MNTTGNSAIVKNYTLDNFKQNVDSMIAANDSAFLSNWSIGRKYNTYKVYTREEVEKIITSGSAEEKVLLSRSFYSRNGLYKRLMLSLATILDYSSILIPNVSSGNKLTESNVQKRYNSAIDYIDRLDLRGVFTNISLRVLVDGSYYGFIKQLDKKGFIIVDLPTAYCISRYKSASGRRIIEMNLEYFNSITDKDTREKTLKTYPKEVARAYKKYINGKINSKWVKIPTELGLYFSFFDFYDEAPLLLNVIPSTMDYDQSVETEKERDLEEIRKILVQKVPHLNDGTLLFEPDEAKIMHDGAVGMMKKNNNVSVLTTYTDVDAIVSKTSNDAATNNLEKMLKNVYDQAGVSKEIFASSGNLTIPYSIKNNIATMMILANKYASVMTEVINKLFGNGNIYFKYKILPVGIQNQIDYVDSLFKLSSSGYSFLMTGVAMGLNQKELINIKTLENDILNLKEVLIPLSSSYTESGDNEGAGRPEKAAEEKSPKTEANQKAIDNQAGGGD